MLTTKHIENAAPKNKLYRLFDALGLYVEITPSGSKLWRLKSHHMGKERRLALGRYPEILFEHEQRKESLVSRSLTTNMVRTGLVPEAI